MPERERIARVRQEWLGLEVAEPEPGHTRWSLPDAVIYPTGGTGVLGMWKAWDELEALGLIGAQRPRMLCVQSEAVPQADLAAELGREWRRTHGWLSPEGAACVVALPQLLERGLVKRRERVVAVDTGSAAKYLPVLHQML